MVIIIGAGLSGLLTAYRLTSAGIPATVLEARDRIGGRIHTINGKNNTPVEMGATWFHPQHQLMITLLEELGLSFFEQYTKGTAFYQPSPHKPTQVVNLPMQEPSYRLAGGTKSLIQKLRDNLSENQVILNQAVKQIKQKVSGLQVTSNTTIYKADKVVLAIPPRLWANSISFEPCISSEVIGAAKQTHTWMEDAIKVSLVYESPFWRPKQQAGTLFSSVGPITEFYDHSNATDTAYALCGFVHPAYGKLSYEQRKEAIMDQLLNTFGTEANQHLDYKEMLWSDEQQTSAKTVFPLQPHQNNGHPIFQNQLYDGSLYISSTEASPYYGGYMEGAISIGNTIANAIIRSK